MQAERRLRRWAAAIGFAVAANAAMAA